MNKTIERVEFKIPTCPQALRVAAYSRVSSSKDTMLHSLSAQVSHYSSYIQAHPGWIYCGVYADEGITGTKEDRANFVRLINDCRAGKIDLVITKSISRFARNTVTLLETVRELKLLGIGVLFEEQNINTLTSDGELMLTILASYAQEESLSASENQKWRIKKNFEEGMPWNGKMLGYRYDKGVYKVVPEEAVIVKRIFADYLSGKGCVSIMNALNREGIPSPNGCKWGKTVIMKILRQYAYTGNLLLQRFYRNNHLDKQTFVNHGERPMYHVEKCHEAIISIDDFNATQRIIAERGEQFAKQGAKNKYPLSGRIICGGCGKNFRRKIRATQVVWICATYNHEGKNACDAKQIPDETITQITKAVLGVTELTEDLLDEMLIHIRAEKGNTLVYRFKDGREVVKHWEDRSRSESWTDEKRKAFSEKLRQARGGKSVCQE